MNRDYSDSDGGYYESRRNIRSSGWQSPLPMINETDSLPNIRIVVDNPFGSKKCDYTIDKSQPGRLNVTARRRNKFLLNNKDHTAVQTFVIPPDADIDHIQTHIEQNKNRLIIEIPRLYNINKTYIRSSEILKPRLRYNDRKYLPNNNNNNHKKFEYRVDCQGYSPDEIDMAVEGRNLIIKGKTKQQPTSSLDSTRQYRSKQFTRMISLPNTVDTSKIVSYVENGELRIEAPVKHENFYYDEQTSGRQVLDRPPSRLERVQSPIPGNYRRQYRRRERKSRQQPLNVMHRVRSAESPRYPFYRSSRDIDDDYDDESRKHGRTVRYERYTTSRNDIKEEPRIRSVYSSPNGIITTRTSHHHYPIEDEMYYKY